jgi:hypothetical protein
LSQSAPQPTNSPNIIHTPATLPQGAMPLAIAARTCKIPAKNNAQNYARNTLVSRVIRK